MNSKVAFLIAVASALFLGACATPYQPYGLLGGYTDTQLQEDKYEVVFEGNGYTSSKRVSDFCLLRCAELALIKDYPYFIIISWQADKEMIAHTSAVSDNASITTITSTPENTRTVAFLKRKPSGSIVENALVFDARAIADSICRRYEIKLDVIKD